MANILSGRVPPRGDAVEAIHRQFEALASPGAALNGEQRVGIAAAARSGEIHDELQTLAHHLYSSPATVHEEHVRNAAGRRGEAATVEVVGIVARLACVDRVNQVLGVDPDPLPGPVPGDPAGDIRSGLKRRRGFLPKPPGEIPVALDLVPSEGQSLRAMFGPMYMTDDEMDDPLFHRQPGLDTPQLETIASRVSFLNECFY